MWHLLFLFIYRKRFGAKEKILFVFEKKDLRESTERNQYIILKAVSVCVCVCNQRVFFFVLYL